MDKKLGPLKIWQWVAIGGVTGLGYLFLHKKTPATESEPILSASGVGPGLGGESGLGGLNELGQRVAGLEAGLQKPPEPGPVGAAGPPGPEAPPLLTPREVAAIERLVESENNPPLAKAKAAAKAIQKKTAPKSHKKNTPGKARRTPKHNAAGHARHQARKTARRTVHAPKAEHHGPKPTDRAHVQHGRPHSLVERVRALQAPKPALAHLPPKRPPARAVKPRPNHPAPHHPSRHKGR